MKAAYVPAAGAAPVYGDFAEPALRPGEQAVRVAASALYPLVRGRASGAHYSARDAYPFAIGVDGVGRLGDGRRVYFILPRAPNGAFAERTAVPAAQCLPLPDALGDVAAAALANPGMSSWAALTRAGFRSGESVLVNGATGLAGRLAVQIARHRGAARVIATGRNASALAALGADAILPLDAPDEAFAEAVAGVDVVLDYLWGASAERLLRAIATTAEDGARCRFVQIGSASGADIKLPSAALRAAAIELMGSGLGSVSHAGLLEALAALLAAAVPARFEIETRTAPLSAFAGEWANVDDARRLVFTTAEVRA